MTPAAEAAGGSRQELLRIHRWMCAAKALDDRMHMLVRQGRAPFVGSSRGHEGIQVAATAALGPDDWAVLHYRGLGNAVARGLTAREWMTRRYNFDSNEAQDALQATPGSTGTKTATNTVNGPTTADIVVIKGP